MWLPESQAFHLSHTENRSHWEQGQEWCSRFALLWSFWTSKSMLLSQPLILPVPHSLTFLAPVMKPHPDVQVLSSPIFSKSIALSQFLSFPFHPRAWIHHSKRSLANTLTRHFQEYWSVCSSMTQCSAPPELSVLPPPFLSCKQMLHGTGWWVKIASPSSPHLKTGANN